MTTFASVEEVYEHFEDVSDPEVAVKDNRRDLFLLYLSAEGELCYQGVPTEADEDDEADVNVHQRCGPLEDGDDLRTRPAWPLTLLIPDPGVNIR